MLSLTYGVFHPYSFRSRQLQMVVWQVQYGWNVSYTIKTIFFCSSGNSGSSGGNSGSSGSSSGNSGSSGGNSGSSGSRSTTRTYWASS